MKRNRAEPERPRMKLGAGLVARGAVHDISLLAVGKREDIKQPEARARGHEATRPHSRGWGLVRALGRGVETGVRRARSRLFEHPASSSALRTLTGSHQGWQTGTQTGIWRQTLYVTQ